MVTIEQWMIEEAKAFGFSNPFDFKLWWDRVPEEY